MTMIQSITRQLLDELSQCKIRFEEGDKPLENRDFFQGVKVKVDPIMDLLDQWVEICHQLIRENNLSVHRQQIDATQENMRTILLHSYYIDVRKRRFMDMHKSCQYVFNQVLNSVNN